MPAVLKISDLDGRGVLAFDLRHFLPFVEAVAPDLHWRFIPSGAATWLLEKVSAIWPIQEFSNRVEDSENGVDLTWRETKELAESTTQCVWVTVIGFRPLAAVSPVAEMFFNEARYIDRAAPEFYDTVEIAFQAVDSSFWLVWARDGAVRERLRADFCEVDVIEVGS